MSNSKKSKKTRRLTIEKVREKTRYRDISDEEAEVIIGQLDRLAEIIVKHIIYEAPERV
ncbi:MAG: hypothetical protein R8G66_06345 [Cytophagales bacterium]|nr:hypothetical protein [Cytophagales bacterium]